MSSKYLMKELESTLAEVPVLDAHTHLVGGRLGARGLHDVLLYHMVVSDLYSAGCPSGARLTQYPNRPTSAGAHARIQEALPYLKHIRNTSSSWVLRMILLDLYGWKEPVTTDNWQRLDGMIRERAEERAWHQAVLSRAGIQRSVTELARRGDGEDDHCLQYALEWAMFTRCQWGEFDTALYELERCWGRSPESPAPISHGKRPPTERTIRTLDDLHAALAHYVNAIPESQVVSVATTFSADIDYRPVGDEEMEKALSMRGDAGVAERNIYASHINESFLAALESKTDKIVYQFSLGAEPLPYETGSRLTQRAIAGIAEMVARHPTLRFQCFLASRHANQSLCTLARELPNLSLAGYWWHNFFPDIIRQVIAERLDMLPANRQIGFFSDAYCVEWAYGKAVLVRKLLARVLGEKIDLGQYSFDDAVTVARAILFESPQSLLGMIPREMQT